MNHVLFFESYTVTVNIVLSYIAQVIRVLWHTTNLLDKLHLHRFINTSTFTQVYKHIYIYTGL